MFYHEKKVFFKIYRNRGVFIVVNHGTFKLTEIYQIFIFKDQDLANFC